MFVLMLNVQNNKQTNSRPRMERSAFASSQRFGSKSLFYISVFSLDACSKYYTHFWCLLVLICLMNIVPSLTQPRKKRGALFSRRARQKSHSSATRICCSGCYGSAICQDDINHIYTRKKKKDVEGKRKKEDNKIQKKRT